MTTVTRTPKQRKPRKPATQPVKGVAQWIGGVPSQGRLDDGDAILKIVADGKEPAFYFVESIRDGGKIGGYRLIKIDGLEKTATYDVEITPNGLRCDCPDATYSERPNCCKHAAGLKAALAAAKLS